MTKRYVWLNISTGEFSDSWTDNDWTEEEHKLFIKGDGTNNFKLIKYECETDEEFAFNKNMVIK